MDDYRCTRVTGKAFEPHYWTLPEERRGPRRDKDEVDMSRVGMARMRPVWDVLCGDVAVHWVRPFTSTEVVRCCSSCLPVVVAQTVQRGHNEQRLPVTVGFIDSVCPETDEFGGECCYRKGHEIPCRFVGGDEDARYAAALERHHEERKA